MKAIKEDEMNKIMKYKKWIVAALAIFVVWNAIDLLRGTMYVDWNGTKTYVANDKKIPMLHSYPKDFPNKLVMAGNMFEKLGPDVKLAFYVEKLQIAEKNKADGVTLKIYADDKIIATKLENPYDKKNKLYFPKYRSAQLDSEIPANTKTLTIEVAPNQNNGWDHVHITEFSVAAVPNTSGVIIFFIALATLIIVGISLVPKRKGKSFKEIQKALELEAEQ
jgi:hypothetical protein